jgi:hypothetical protein
MRVPMRGRRTQKCDEASVLCRRGCVTRTPKTSDPNLGIVFYVADEARREEIA